MNGASSSGKSSFGRKLQNVLERPFFYLSSDQFVESNILPNIDRENSDQINSWNVVRPKFFSAFHKTIKAFAEAGNLVIVEHVVEQENWFYELVNLLKDESVLYIGIMCPVEEIDRREKIRGDRYIGEGRSHIKDGIHTWSKYDIEINTHEKLIEENIDIVMKSISEYSKENSIFSTIGKEI